MADISSEFKAALKGACRSLTVWVSAVLFALPEIVPLIQANFSTVTPFIPESISPQRVMQVLALLMLVLRIKTTTSLAEKGRKP